MQLQMPFEELFPLRQCENAISIPLSGIAMQTALFVHIYKPHAEDGHMASHSSAKAPLLPNTAKLSISLLGKKSKKAVFASRSGVGFLGLVRRNAEFKAFLRRAFFYGV
jgi:hypothetical protein